MVVDAISVRRRPGPAIICGVASDMSRDKLEGFLAGLCAALLCVPNFAGLHALLLAALDVFAVSVTGDLQLPLPLHLLPPLGLLLLCQALFILGDAEPRKLIVCKDTRQGTVA